MARGFESKDVEYQQAEAERRKAFGRALTREEREVASRKRTLQLALAKARADREAVRSDAHRRMIDEAIAALEADLRRVDEA
jgi:hypothetical protein